MSIKFILGTVDWCQVKIIIFWLSCSFGSMVDEHEQCVTMKLVGAIYDSCKKTNVCEAYCFIYYACDCWVMENWNGRLQ